MGFYDDISKFVIKVEKNGDGFMRQFSQEVMLEILKGTPVATSFLKNSWTPALNSPTMENNNGAAVGAGGSLSLERIGVVMLNVKMGDVLYYTNTAEYGVYVEFGTSRQAGQAFVRNVVARADTIAKDVANKILKGGFAGA